MSMLLSTCSKYCDIAAMFTPLAIVMIIRVIKRLWCALTSQHLVRCFIFVSIAWGSYLQLSNSDIITGGRILLSCVKESHHIYIYHVYLLQGSLFHKKISYPIHFMSFEELFNYTLLVQHVKKVQCIFRAGWWCIFFFSVLQSLGDHLDSRK